MAGIIAYGAYVPYHRLRRADIADTLGSGGGKGTRSVASYDEDTTSMAVEAARATLPPGRARERVEQLFLATATPPYLDKTNAAAVHAALGLDEQVLAADMAGAVRSGVAALLAGASAAVPTLSVLADLRTGAPGGADESAGGDGAAAFLFAGHREDMPVLAQLIGHSTVSDEILERWRLPGASSSRVWEERFSEGIYVSQAAKALGSALDGAGIAASAIDHFAVVGLHARACAAVRRSADVRPEAHAPDYTGVIGNAGTAQPGLQLADALDRAQPGETIALVVLGDGVSVLLFRTTDALPAHRAAKPVADQAAAGAPAMKYATFLSWRGMLDREPPRRPDPEPPYAPPAHRRAAWKYAFIGSRCEKCATRHLPAERVCRSCGEVDAMAAEPMEHVRGKVATFTVDRLAFTPSPPMIAVVVDFDGGGRFRCELTDATEAEAVIGGRVEMTFRRTVTANGIHNYFWKARPVREAEAPAPAAAVGDESREGAR
ncbi:OB-fold domain-containing protein [Streptomyces sp. NPDC005356]|uniref:OB-fold domain-containing protein n=1 Tax=Streptomyces sp. NPDC005356 TaxID=3157167 RepID=UPI0033B93C52